MARLEPPAVAQFTSSLERLSLRRRVAPPPAATAAAAAARTPTPTASVKRVDGVDCGLWIVEGATIGRTVPRYDDSFQACDFIGCAESAMLVFVRGFVVVMDHKSLVQLYDYLSRDERVPKTPPYRRIEGILKKTLPVNTCIALSAIKAASEQISLYSEFVYKCTSL